MTVKRIFYTCLFSLTILYAQAQKDVILNIQHLLGTEPFAFERQVTNNMDHAFSISRLDYYMSNITLHHDGGKASLAKDLFILVRKNEPISQNLGKFNINQLDSITFNLGIDSTYNHADPSLWPASHALSPKDPDMHWGWAAGYKFAVIEGHNGPDIFYDMQMHAFGDPLLSKVSIPVVGQIQSDKMIISLNADYSKVLNGINLDRVILVHGSSKDVIKFLKNFNDYVFTEALPTSSTVDLVTQRIKSFPNPSNTDQIMIELPTDLQSGAVLTIKDLNGKIVKRIANPMSLNQVMLSTRGLYIIEVIQGAKITAKGTVIRL